MSNDPREAAREAEARAALERVKRDSETLLGTSMGRAADHFSGADAPEGDRIELWGRRIGRTLSLLGVIVLGWWLGHQLKFW
ncbi:MAG: hypothetical protein ACTHP8_05570 [Bosea sp. (in: a-proteobacteria)]|uniref:hypothetical protein n=1 Tax=unclassified Bosea (in: a-proteobacteria) TaxID=2653178 RepID=UPI00095EDF96|nr:MULTISPECIES: hypothetical protein [unclassified Bosea (in: a-proteobacteria)]MBN9445014.1 hypothetical protein [Bosea sp. (in: a-proteobacteria)]MBN9455938.1 hypothetical protein [Bosea sp. (in: a-proteobacteria)]OJV05902.1 MAG: hypothetical protein BGO20_12740 [Bosea sp. 67-29]